MNRYHVLVVTKNNKEFSTIVYAANVAIAATKGIGELITVYGVKLADVADLHVTSVVM